MGQNNSYMKRRTSPALNYFIQKMTTISGRYGHKVLKKSTPNTLISYYGSRLKNRYQ